MPAAASAPERVVRQAGFPTSTAEISTMAVLPLKGTAHRKAVHLRHLDIGQQQTERFAAARGFAAGSDGS
jgi:hypothetical protein